MQLKSVLLRTFLLMVSVSVGMIGAKTLSSKDVIAVEPSHVIDIHVTDPGAVKEATFQLKSNVSYPVNVIGVALPCSCMEISPIPVSIEPKGSVEMTLKIHLADLRIDPAALRRGEIAETIQVYTEYSDVAPILAIRLVDDV
ncbi:hypothetical protein [Crateriforma conspicua]|uniref:hypothetical protein n=1 Tax=Crateriforma conspicua TaxID=2527996 RepID=UPI0011884F16|nr:hypothetical protein [Crateriforma conspicua]QDV64442.1 hypothetical protein Mal65_36000 [Crateriforma conspicua]